MSAGVSTPGRRMTSASVVSVRRTGIPFSEAISVKFSDVAVLEMGEDGGGAGDVADLRGLAVTWRSVPRRLPRVRHDHITAVGS
jgi:hypothetical protein